MALVIAQQPSALDLMSAYNPIPFVVYANQPTSGDPCRVVFADVYFNSIYYGTFSTTVYYAIVGPYAEYHFDIQDKVQEYLRSQMLIIPVIGANGELTRHFSDCFVRFRETDTDANGFTVSVGTAPIQGTYYTDPVDGDGEESNTFIVLNTSLKHEDSYDLLTHMKKYTPSHYGGFEFGWSLSHRPNDYSYYNYTTGGGKYYVCPTDHDMLAWFTYDNMDAGGGSYIACEVTYADGTTATDFILMAAMPVPFTSGINRSHFLNAGVPNMSALLPLLSFANAVSYKVIVGGIFVDYAIQTYYLKNDGCCNDRIRILFQNLLGGWDGINFDLVEETSKSESAFYQKSKPYIFPDKKDRGLARFQPKQADTIECTTEDYTEADMPWIKELIGSAQAFIQVKPDPLQNQDAQFFPIIILDSEIVTLKKYDTYVYNVTIKFQYANQVTNLRS